jgi:hypothetical protein
VKTAEKAEFSFKQTLSNSDSVHCPLYAALDRFPMAMEFKKKGNGCTFNVREISTAADLL